jgi:flavin reductase (DIM6/NTAB) family NADH-FMN oxidoreductase RutF
VSNKSSSAESHITIEPSVLYFGTPVVLIATQNADGTANITPMSSVWALGHRVVLGLSPASQGAENIMREGECTLNFPSANLWERVEKIGRSTGRYPVPTYKVESGYSYSADKFALGGFTRMSSKAVKSPRIRECPLQFEAKLLLERSGNQTISDGHVTLELEVLHVHAAPDIVVPGTNHIDTRHWNPLFYVFRHYFGNAEDLGQNFRSEI